MWNQCTQSLDHKSTPFVGFVPSLRPFIQVGWGTRWARYLQRIWRVVVSHQKNQWQFEMPLFQLHTGPRSHLAAEFTKSASIVLQVTLDALTCWSSDSWSGAVIHLIHGRNAPERHNIRIRIRCMFSHQLLKAWSKNETTTSVLLGRGTLWHRGPKLPMCFKWLGHDRNISGTSWWISD